MKRQKRKPFDPGIGGINAAELRGQIKALRTTERLMDGYPGGYILGRIQDRLRERRLSLEKKLRGR